MMPFAVDRLLMQILQGVVHPAVDVRMPLAGLAAIIQVQHGGDRVHAESVDMELIQPEAGVGH